MKTRTWRTQRPRLRIEDATKEPNSQQKLQDNEADQATMKNIVNTRLRETKARLVESRRPGCPGVQE